MPITLERIRSKAVTVGIIGLGYVGYPLALLFGESNLKVIGFDIDESKVNAINSGFNYIKHIDGGRLKALRAEGGLEATADYGRVRECDALIICVPTPLSRNMDPDLYYIEATCKAIGPHLRPHTLVSLESSTFPGTTEEIVKPLLESLSPFREGRDLYLCFSPEREDPGNGKFNTRNIPKLVGASDPTALGLASALYALAIDEVVSLPCAKIAEAAKLFENIFRSVNIALVNELKVILDAMNIDVWEVIRAASTKPFGFMPFWPGPGLGGHCIPIDPFYLTWKAKEFGMHTRFIELAGEINRSMPNWVAGKIQDCLNHHAKPLKGSKILLLGLSYKPDVEDMRESPTLELMHILERKGALTSYHDPYVPQIGGSREYGDLAGRCSHEISNEFDCMVVCTRHSCFESEDLLKQGVPIIDTRNLLPKHPLVFAA